MPARIGTTRTQLTLQAAFGERPFTAADAAAAGVTRRQLQGAVGVGKIRHLSRHLYAVTESDLRLRALRHQQDLGDRGIRAPAGARCAAEIWGVPVIGKSGPLPPSMPMLWVPPSTVRRGVRGGVHYGVADIPEAHVVTLPDGLVMTSPLRTAVDVVRLSRLPRRLALASIVGGLRAHAAYTADIDPRDSGAITELVQCADRRVALREELRAVAAACPSWGMSSVWRCLSVADPRLENALESISFGCFLDAGVPLPVPQVWLQGASGRWWRVDFWWEEFGIIGEADGMVKYADRQALVEEKARQLDLEAPGRSVHRWGWSNALRDGDPLMGQFLERLGTCA